MFAHCELCFMPLILVEMSKRINSVMCPLPQLKNITLPQKIIRDHLNILYGYFLFRSMRFKCQIIINNLLSL